MFCLVFCFYFLRQCWQVAQAGLNSCLNLLRTRVTHMCLHSWHLVFLFVCVKHDPESGVSCCALTEATSPQQSCLLRCARHGPDLLFPRSLQCSSEIPRSACGKLAADLQGSEVECSLSALIHQSRNPGEFFHEFPLLPASLLADGPLAPVESTSSLAT